MVTIDLTASRPGVPQSGDAGSPTVSFEGSQQPCDRRSRGWCQIDIRCGPASAGAVTSGSVRVARPDLPSDRIKTVGTWDFVPDMPAVFCSGASTHHSRVALAVSFAAGGRLQKACLWPSRSAATTLPACAISTTSAPTKARFATSPVPCATVSGACRPTGNLPDFPAPIVRTSADGVRELAVARWGMPSPALAPLALARAPLPHAARGLQRAGPQPGWEASADLVRTRSG
jgi:hypothetical protein